MVRVLAGLDHCRSPDWWTARGAGRARATTDYQCWQGWVTTGIIPSALQNTECLKLWLGLVTAGHCNGKGRAWVNARHQHCKVMQVAVAEFGA